MRIAQSLRGGSAWLRDGLSAISNAILSAFTWFLLLVVAGSTLLVAGVLVIAGTGWALVAGGALLMFAGIVVLKGMTRA
jgi:hypothetical protein